MNSRSCSDSIFFLEFFSWTVEQLTLIFIGFFFFFFFFLCRVLCLFILVWLMKKRTNQFEANSSKSFSVFFSKNFTQENKFFDIFEFRIISMIYVLYFFIFDKNLMLISIDLWFFLENNYRIEVLFELFFNENV